MQGNFRTPDIEIQVLQTLEFLLMEAMGGWVGSVKYKRSQYDGKKEVFYLLNCLASQKKARSLINNTIGLLVTKGH